MSFIPFSFIKKKKKINMERPNFVKLKSKDSQYNNGLFAFHVKY